MSYGAQKCVDICQLGKKAVIVGHDYLLFSVMLVSCHMVPRNVSIFAHPTSHYTLYTMYMKFWGITDYISESLETKL